MKISIDRKELIELLEKQIGSLFKISITEKNLISKNLKKVLLRTEYCFSKSKNRYFKKNKKTFFDPFHSDQYSIFLYFASQEAQKHGNRSLADRIYYLNKMLNCCDLYYEVDLPEIFFLDHQNLNLSLLLFYLNTWIVLRLH